MNNFQLPKGFKIGNAHNDHTGVTVVLPDSPCSCGVDVRGGAPGTRETDLLKSEKTVSQVNAVALCGGSAYGLEAACGIMSYLRKQKIGFKALDKVVPIVPAAVIFDLNHGYFFPDMQMGEDACRCASTTPQLGRVGAGRGATVGKIRGAKNASAGGVGIATVKAYGINVTAVIVVNAFGDVYDYRTNTIVAGAKNSSGFANTHNSILSGSVLRLLFGMKNSKNPEIAPDSSDPASNTTIDANNYDDFTPYINNETRNFTSSSNSDGLFAADSNKITTEGGSNDKNCANDAHNDDNFAAESNKITAEGGSNDNNCATDTEADDCDVENIDILDSLLGTNTTIGCIITDAKLSKTECNKLASCAHDGLALSIRPVHTDFDGDTLFCMASGKKRVLSFAFLQTMAVEAVARAVVSAVKGE